MLGATLNIESNLVSGTIKLPSTPVSSGGDPCVHVESHHDHGEGKKRWVQSPLCCAPHCHALHYSQGPRLYWGSCSITLTGHQQTVMKVSQLGTLMVGISLKDSRNLSEKRTKEKKRSVYALWYWTLKMPRTGWEVGIVVSILSAFLPTVLRTTHDVST